MNKNIIFGGFTMSKIINGQELDINAIANKYLDKKITTTSQDNFVEEFSSVSNNSSAVKPSKDFATIVLKNGQKIQVEEDSLLYEKALGLAHSKFIRVDLDRFINPSEIAEFVNVDSTIDYSKKDVLPEEPEEEKYNDDWKDTFGMPERY
jgi:hypothetical protein